MCHIERDAAEDSRRSTRRSIAAFGRFCDKGIALFIRDKDSDQSEVLDHSPRVPELAGLGFRTIEAEDKTWLTMSKGSPLIVSEAPSDSTGYHHS